MKSGLKFLYLIWRSGLSQKNDYKLPPDRSVDCVDAQFIIVGTNRSVLYAGLWLKNSGAKLSGVVSLEEVDSDSLEVDAILVSGDTTINQAKIKTKSPIIYLWDYEVGKSGIGVFASAVSGVSSVIGKPGGPPGYLPDYIPEQWVGIFGANLALSQVFQSKIANVQNATRIDVSAADVLRAFAEQNSGNHAGVSYGWRRNGLTAVEHGGVFPQGFFRCKDGHVAVQARSRQDWSAILDAFGNPEWSCNSDMQNPFKLSENDSLVLPLFQSELDKLKKHEILNLAIKTGAPMAPVLTIEEAFCEKVFRPDFRDEKGNLNWPFVFKRNAQQMFN